MNLSIDDLQAALASVFAGWVKELDLQVLEVGDGSVLLALPVTAHQVHSGGVLCGQSLMAAADTAMVLAVMTRLGGFMPMTTVQLQTSFLRPVPADAGAVHVRATVLRLGRSLVFGEVHMNALDGPLVAHATTTYALV
jgi:uncharacterized protein (TIGR00369 family)